MYQLQLRNTSPDGICSKVGTTPFRNLSVACSGASHGSAGIRVGLSSLESSCTVATFPPKCVGHWSVGSVLSWMDPDGQCLLSFAIKFGVFCCDVAFTVLYAGDDKTLVTT